MSVELLDKTRKVNNLLHFNFSTRMRFADMCDVLSETMNSDVAVLSRKGKLLGSASAAGADKKPELLQNEVGTFVDKALNDRLLAILSTKENVNLQTLGFSREQALSHPAIVCPIDIGGERLGTLIFIKTGEMYDIDDIILAEYGTTVVGLEMMRSVIAEKEEESRRRESIRSALRTLTYTELEAMDSLFAQLENGTDGIVIASRIADEFHITRSIIVNSIRKLESAGVIESRSAGMRGTYVRVVCPGIQEEIRSELNTKNT